MEWKPGNNFLYLVHFCCMPLCDLQTKWWFSLFGHRWKQTLFYNKGRKGIRIFGKCFDWKSISIFFEESSNVRVSTLENNNWNLEETIWIIWTREITITRDFKSENENRCLSVHLKNILLILATEAGYNDQLIFWTNKKHIVPFGIFFVRFRWSNQRSIAVKKAPTRFELVISCLLDRRFNQLSHGAVAKEK